MTDNPAPFKLSHSSIDGVVERIEMDEQAPFVIPDGFLT